MPSLTNLAPEVLDLVVSNFDIPTLCSARLVSRSWNSLATKRLFHSITLTPVIGVEKWNNLSQSEHLRTVPRHGTVNSSPVPDYQPWSMCGTDPEYDLISEWLPQYEDEQSDEPQYRDYYHGIANLARFCNLDSATLHFTSSCSADGDDTGDENVEAPDYRLDILKRFFTALQLRQADSLSTVVRTLTIENLQNLPISEFTSSDLFTSIMRDIEHLHLQICEECNHAGPDHDIYLEELRTFMPHLHEAWLNPYKNQLRSLSLSFLDGWGPLPGYFDGMHLQFPRMERLTLGNFMVAHNNALDWVLAQKSLKYLKLHKCRIVSHLRLDAAVLGDWDVRTHDWEALDAGEWDYPEDDKVFYYSGAWHQFFDRINEELPHLEDFEFISDVPERHIRGDWDNSTKLSAARYICFDEGLLPSRWIDPESFERQPDRHSETQDKDWVALENLRRTLERRRGSAGKKT